MSTEDKYCDVLVVLDLGSGKWLYSFSYHMSFLIWELIGLVYAKSSGVSPSYLIIYQNGRFTL